MNRFEKIIKETDPNHCTYARLVSGAKKYLEIQLSKVTEIERYNHINMPKYVIDAIIDAWGRVREKRAFIIADKLRKKPAKWLIDMNVIEIAYVYKNGKPSIYVIKNIPDDWINYEDFKISADKKSTEIFEKTFKNGMKIFD